MCSLEQCNNKRWEKTKASYQYVQVVNILFVYELKRISNPSLRSLNAVKNIKMSKEEFKKLKTDELNSRTGLLRSATHQLPHRSRGVSE